MNGVKVPKPGQISSQNPIWLTKRTTENKRQQQENEEKLDLMTWTHGFHKVK